jgi:hypothetical protein
MVVVPAQRLHTQARLQLTVLFMLAFDSEAGVRCL